MRQLQTLTTARDDNACGVAEDIDELFGKHLREKGLNLDSNRRKKRALVDFLLSVPETLETVLKNSHIVKSLIEAGMIDEETKMVPVFEELMDTCKRWGSGSKAIGVPIQQKNHCRKQFQALMKLQCSNGQITYPDMKTVEIPVSKCCYCYSEYYNIASS